MPRRVVITSTGCFTSLGHNEADILNAFKNETVTFTNLPYDPMVPAAPIDKFKLIPFSGRFKEARYLNRGAALGVAAALEAVRNSGLDSRLLAEAGLFTGCGPNFDISHEFAEIKNGKMDVPSLPALWMLKYLPNTMASVIAKQVGLHGENLTVNTACSASLQAIGEAYRKIRDGYLDLALAGGGDSRLNPGGILAYKKAKALNIDASMPTIAGRPFDKQSNGFVPGEGAAFFILEEPAHAQNRGAAIIGEICGFGSSMDGGSLTAPEISGRWAGKAVRTALDEAGLNIDQIEVISAHGTGTVLNDTMEATLIERIFVSTPPPLVIALKSWVGHSAAACGAVETMFVLLCLRHGFVPKIRNLETPRHPGLNYCLKSRQNVNYQTALIENFGFGGQNAALILKKWQP